MQQLEFASEIAAPVEVVWAFYDSLDTLVSITPPGTKVRVVNPPSRLSAGVRFTLLVSQPPIFVPLPWETVITVYEPPFRFVDVQGFGPFAYWRHEHLFLPTSQKTTVLHDRVTYETPFGPFGTLADLVFIRRQLTAMFDYRHQQTQKWFLSNAG